jgi:hypothetical protein
VNHTALSAINAGFRTAIYVPCIRGIDLKGTEEALEGLKQKGGVLVDDISSLQHWVE